MTPSLWNTGDAAQSEVFDAFDAGPDRAIERQISPEV